MARSWAACSLPMLRRRRGHFRWRRDRPTHRRWWYVDSGDLAQAVRRAMSEGLNDVVNPYRGPHLCTVASSRTRKVAPATTAATVVTLSATSKPVGTVFVEIDHVFLMQHVLCSAISTSPLLAGLISLAHASSSAFIRSRCAPSMVGVPWFYWRQSRFCLIIYTVWLNARYLKPRFCCGAPSKFLRNC
jgi:hypothetical protein